MICGVLCGVLCGVRSGVACGVICGVGYLIYDPMWHVICVCDVWCVMLSVLCGL